MPTGALDLALWMESDRMGHLPALTEEKFVNQRDVVLNERRQNTRTGARPGGCGARGAVPAGSPHWITIGDPEDLRRHLGDVRTFFETYYHPGNASLTLAGDVAVDRALELAEQWLRRDSAGPVLLRLGCRSCDRQPVASARRPRRTAALYLSWHSPAMFSPTMPSWTCG